MIQQKQLHHFTQNQLHILMISISHIVKKCPKLAKCPYYRLDVLAKFGHFQTCQPIFGQMRDMLTINAWVSNTMREIGSLRRIYGKYTAMHENIRTLHLILCVSIAIVGGNKTQMRESHTQCVRVGRSAFLQCTQNTKQLISVDSLS